MDIRELSPENFVDIFGGGGQGAVAQPKPTSFGSHQSDDANIFQSTSDTTTFVEGSVDTSTTLQPVDNQDDDNPGSTSESTTESTTQNPDILGMDDEKEGKDEKKKDKAPEYEFKDISGYFEDRIKNGKFVAITEEKAGKKVQFIPKTPEEFDEVIDIQVEYKLEERAKEVEQKIYQSKSPAWQAVLKFSELVDDPTEILPFIQGVQTIESVQDIDENDVDGAEKIIRIRLQQRGDSDDVIDENIEALKTTDKLVTTAQKYKPIILNEEKQRIQRMVQEERQKEAEYQALVTSVRENAIKAIEAPIFGKQKLKNDEKAIIYDMIAEPSPESQGYGIFNAIDALFEKGDFETLKQVALLVGKKDAFLNYLSSGVADKTAGDLQRKLRVSTDSRASGSGDQDTIDSDRPAVQRNQYTRGGFGRN